MYLMDYHHHTNHSFDSNAKMEDVCIQAIKRGIKEICFTEHFSVNPLASTFGHMNFDRYFLDITNCREKFGSLLNIKVGIELCEPHLLMEQYQDEIGPLDLDFILGSVHNIDNRKLRLVLQEHQHHAYQLYFEVLYKLVSLADIDVLAHLDLMKRYAHKEFGLYHFPDYEEGIREILRKAIQRNIGIEINTSGLRSDLGQPLPSFEIIKLYKELGERS
ncbi:histidinol-phosphatase HisJ family protein [Bacillus sp. T3]|uniref:histidinol-phosphatase HisJ family protein n=1 Tax=Bacillus sp. T3 TaxID=467262 RepID=UPI0029811FC0|nr:histidinol-phosphatase HisJ family protein [Bacillus sp. T3]